MARFELRIPSSRPVAETWSRVVDWKRHGSVVPATAVRFTGGPQRSDPDVPAVGEQFIAHSGIGPVSFDDVMKVTALDDAEPPRTVDVEKIGAVVGGTIHIAVAAADGAGGVRSVLVWRQDLRLAPVPGIVNRLLSPVLSAAGSAGYGYALRRLLA